MGTALSAVHAAHFVDGMATIVGALLVSGLGLSLSASLAAAGVLAYRRPSVPAPVRWTAVGVAAGVGVALVTLARQATAGGTVVSAGYYVAAVAAQGGILGFAAGFFRLRARDRALAADRARTEFDDLFERLPNPAVDVVCADDGARVRRVNEAFESTVHPDAESVRGQRLRDLFGETADVGGDGPTSDASLGRQVVEGVTGPLASGVFRRTGDGVRYFDLYVLSRSRSAGLETDLDDLDGVCPSGVEGVASGIVVAVEVTDRVRRERRVAVLNRFLRHDLRNRLNVVEGHAELLSGGDVDAETAAGAIRDAAESLAVVADRSRETERLLRKHRDDPTPTDVASVVERVVDRCVADRPAAEHDVTVATPERARGLADDLLPTAVEEVVENALEHGGERVTVTVSESGEGVRVEVADDGTGVPASERAVFRQGTETDLEHASGLGLWLTHWIVEDVGGRVRVTDRDPTGTVVSLELPPA